MRLVSSFIEQFDWNPYNSHNLKHTMWVVAQKVIAKFIFINWIFKLVLEIMQLEI